MRREYPDILFERYADDAICHCRSEALATTSAISTPVRRAALAKATAKPKTRSSRPAARSGLRPFAARQLALPRRYPFVRNSDSGRTLRLEMADACDIF